MLDGVSLSVAPGERLLIRGPSGAGKTTLFHVLGLLAEPTAGTLRVAGEDAAALGERRRARLRREHVGVVFQDFQLVPDLTVRENVALPQEHAGDRDDDRIDRLLAALAIADRAGQYPASLSGGEKQRVAAARALANRPAVVLADEPTGQLDPDSADRLLELLVEVQAETGTALVVVSHDRTLSDRFERVLRLAGGTLAPVAGTGQ
ncbi:MAG: ABC transporter ATP-binding protein [Halobacteriales archaeon]